MQKPLKDLIVIRRMFSHGSRFSQDLTGICLRHHFSESEQPAAIHTSEHGIDLRLVHFTFAKGDGLICQAQRIPHTALSCAAQRPERRFVVWHRLGLQYFTQVTDNTFRSHILQAELKAARKYSYRELLWVGRRQQKFNVLRRLFERFQQGVKTVG